MTLIYDMWQVFIIVQDDVDIWYMASIHYSSLFGKVAYQKLK